MSPSATARTQRHDERALRRPRPHGAAHARRVSGPVSTGTGRAHAQAPATAHRQMRGHAPAYAPAGGRLPARGPIRPLRLVAGPAQIALRVADSAVNVSASRTMDRLVRSRAWVVIIGVGLIGIVAMQVSLLKLNSGIGRAVDTVATLERSNASLKAEVSELSSGDRIQSLAGDRGFVMPEPADVTYLRAGDKRSDGFRAARRMRAPDRSIAGPAGALTAVKAPDSLTGAAGATAPTGATGANGAPAATGVTAPTGATAPTGSAGTIAPAPTTQAPATAAPPQLPAASATTGTSAAGVTSAAPQTTSAGGVTTP